MMKQTPFQITLDSPQWIGYLQKINQVYRHFTQQDYARLDEIPAALYLCQFAGYNVPQGCSHTEPGVFGNDVPVIFGHTAPER